MGESSFLLWFQGQIEKSASKSDSRSPGMTFINVFFMKITFMIFYEYLQALVKLAVTFPAIHGLLKHLSSPWLSVEKSLGFFFF